MNREIDVNKNYDDFGKSFITSRKPYQICAIVIAFVLGVVVMLFVKPIFGTTVASYMALLIVIPPGVVGVYERHGMDFAQYVRKKKITRKHGKIRYSSTVGMHIISHR